MYGYATTNVKELTQLLRYATMDAGPEAWFDCPTRTDSLGPHTWFWWDNYQFNSADMIQKYIDREVCMRLSCHPLKRITARDLCVLLAEVPLPPRIPGTGTEDQLRNFICDQVMRVFYAMAKTEETES
jgi:hypothetical protein